MDSSCFSPSTEECLRIDRASSEASVKANYSMPPYLIDITGRIADLALPACLHVPYIDMRFESTDEHKLSRSLHCNESWVTTTPAKHGSATHGTAVTYMTENCADYYESCRETEGNNSDVPCH